MKCGCILDFDSQKKQSAGICSNSSTSSSDEDDDNDDKQWWKPSRKSMLKLYKERKTMKTFSFLASLSSTIS